MLARPSGTRLHRSEIAGKRYGGHCGDKAPAYNAACYYSVAGDVERAIDLLERACVAGGSSAWFEHDSDLNPLRSNPRFQRLLSQLDAAGATASDKFA